MLNNLFDNEWSSVWGSSDVEGREGGGKHLTPQNWNPGRGQTGGMLGFIIIQLNETRVVEFAKKKLCGAVFVAAV